MLLTAWLHPPRSALRALRRSTRRKPPRRRNGLYLNPHLPAPAIELLEDRTLLSSNSGLELPGMRLVDPTANHFDGQIIYLDFDGAKDVTYHGPVTVGPFDVPAFQAPAELAGQEHAIITSVVQQLEQTFAGSGVIFTTVQPADGTEYSTLYIGGDDSAFREYGSFLGLAEEVDAGNNRLTQQGFVFSHSFRTEYQQATGVGIQLANIIAHEAGHILGFEHNMELSQSPLSPLAQTVTLPATKDAYVSQSAPTLNFGGTRSLDVWHPIEQIEYRSLIHIPVNSIPPGSSVLSANLVLRATTENNGLVRAYPVTQSWSESTVTWNNQPFRASSEVDQQVVTETGLVVFDVTQLVQDWVDGDKNNRGFVLEGNDGETIFASREAGGDTPVLVVGFDPPDNPPDAELTLSPGTIDTAGVTTTLRVEYTDDQSIDVATLDSNDILITGPNSYSQTATFISVDNPNPGSPREATYLIDPPGGRWDHTDNGEYTIQLQPNQVRDNVGQPASEAVLSSFNVSIPAPPAGITIITHGWQPDLIDSNGEYPPDWALEMAIAILDRSGGAGNLFVHDTRPNEPTFGDWVPLSTLNAEVTWANSDDVEDPTVLVYNWVNDSNDSEQGWLEAAADNLFASLLDGPFDLGVGILQKALHFIGHSRGAVVNSIVTNLIGHYFPEVVIEQVTSLDPHPIDADGFDLGVVYEADDPDIYTYKNVTYADNYYRRDGVYPALSD